MGKFFERIVPIMAKRRLSNYCPDLLCDLYCVINMIKRKIERGDVVLELSVDAVNAFNSLSWKTIEVALEHHTFFWY